MTYLPDLDVLAGFGVDVSDRLDDNPKVYCFPTEKAQIYGMRGFLSAKQCRTLIKAIDRDAQPSTLFSPHKDPDFRTSSSCNFQRGHPDVVEVTQMIADLLGIPAEHGETIQGQRYRVGEQFKLHHDFFHPNTSYWEQVMASAGQRSWTAMVYLNAPQSGGATNFPHLGFGVAPETGMLLAWNNMQPDGIPNRDTAHIGTPVTAGTKYIITNWFRERPWVAAPDTEPQPQ